MMEIDNKEVRYLESGHAVAVEAVLTNGYLVIAIKEDGETGEWYLSERKPFFVEKVYEEAPYDAICKRILQLKEDERAAVEAVNKIDRELTAAEKAAKDRIEHLKKYEGLQLLEDFMEGRITHYVMVKYGDIEVLPFEDATDQEARREYGTHRGPLRLLLLYGDHKKDLHWALSKYSNYSSGETLVYPCVGEDQVKPTIQGVIDKWIEALDTDKHIRGVEDIVEQADLHGLSIPEWVREQHQAQLIKRAAEAVAQKKRDLAEAEQELQAIQSNEVTA